MIKITVLSRDRKVSDYVPVRDQDGQPLPLEVVAASIRSVAETMAWMALGYPEADFLSQGNPWAGLERKAEEEKFPCVVYCPDCNAWWPSPDKACPVCGRQPPRHGGEREGQEAEEEPSSGMGPSSLDEPVRRHVYDDDDDFPF